MQRNPNSAVKLSPREAEVLHLLCTEGACSKLIAERLGIAESTVNGYLDALSTGLNLVGRSVLMIWGWQHPEAIKGKWTEPSLHPASCRCGGAFCSIEMDRAA